jgi:hypothetical protein
MYLSHYTFPFNNAARVATTDEKKASRICWAIIMAKSPIVKCCPTGAKKKRATQLDPATWKNTTRLTKSWLRALAERGTSAVPKVNETLAKS